MEFFEKLKTYFSPKTSNSIVVRSKTEDGIIEQSNNEVELYLQKALNLSDSFSVFAQRQQGALEIIKKNVCRLAQIFDGLYLSATNQKDDSETKFKTADSLKEKNKLYDESKVNYSIEQNSNKKRKSIRIYRHIERLGILKRRRTYLDESLSNLSQGMEKEVDLRVAKRILFQRALIVLGIIIASGAEAGNAMNSLMILRSNPLLELFTVCGIALGLIVSSKALVYLFSEGNILGKTTTEKAKINAQDIGGIAVLMLCIGFVFYLAELRIEFMIESKLTPSEPVEWFIRLSGLLLFSSTVLLAMLLSNAKGKLRALYCSTLLKLQKVDRKVKSLQVKLSRIRLRYEMSTTRAKNNLQTERAYIFDDRPREHKEQLLLDTDTQNTILAMSRKSKMELIHGAQALIFSARADMEQKLGESHPWTTLDMNSILTEPQYQILNRETPVVQNRFSILRPAIFILGFLGLFSCNSFKKEITVPQTEIISIVDETSWNPLQMELSAEDVLHLGHVESNEAAHGVNFSAYTLNDISLNRNYTAKLKPSDEFMVNSFSREEEIQAFSEEISGIFNQVYAIQPETFEYTELWVPLAKILEMHAKSEAHKVVIIQSDMLENGLNISFYQLQSALEKNPEKIIEYLNELYPLEYLYDYEILILYQANRENDRMFTTATNVFAGLLREKGATVSIKASL